jgi:ribosome maturation factor RimP
LTELSQAKRTVERIKALAEPVVAREGYELIDVELGTDHGRSILRLYIDNIDSGSGAGVTVEDCSHVSRIVGDLLDVEEPIEGAFNLEVSSPGLFRPLTKPAHFDRAIGERVKVKTFQKHGDRRVFTGVLRAHEEGHLLMEVDGREYRLSLKDVAKANLEPALEF